MDYGVGVIPWSPLGGGLLGGVLRKLEEGRRASAETQAQRRWRCGHSWSVTRPSAATLGEAEADVALAWLLAQPAVTAPIIGPADRQQLQGSLRALEITLDAAQLAALDEIWPGPGGRAARRREPFSGRGTLRALADSGMCSPRQTFTFPSGIEQAFAFLAFSGRGGEST